MPAEEKSNKEVFQQWHDDPSNWKWGIFYFNKKDKRLLSPKRIQELGWTINFANPYSIVLLIMIIILAITIGLLIK
jgi:uncharacterized membrane protein